MLLCFCVLAVLVDAGCALAVVDAMLLWKDVPRIYTIVSSRLFYFFFHRLYQVLSLHFCLISFELPWFVIRCDPQLKPAERTGNPQPAARLYLNLTRLLLRLEFPFANGWPKPKRQTCPASDVAETHNGTYH